MTKFFCLIPAFLCLVFLACKKKEKESETPVNSSGSTNGHSSFETSCPSVPRPVSNPDMLACKFKPGTFWVFLDSVTNVIDTLSVQSLTAIYNSLQLMLEITSAITSYASLAMTVRLSHKG